MDHSIWFYIHVSDIYYLRNRIIVVKSLEKIIFLNFSKLYLFIVFFFVDLTGTFIVGFRNNEGTKKWKISKKMFCPRNFIFMQTTLKFINYIWPFYTIRGAREGLK